ncbi:PAAR domain-containing protein [Pseudomonas tolaasii]|uniref:PAAR domain-containing protein n=1 Tax=Pseudomonas tolaasii TaxID=29442 RepID=UPI000A30AEA1|nr:PAAR domain-containing protein [Pseudomonas tolaasii]
MQRYHITVGAKTTSNGSVRSGSAGFSIDGMAKSIEGDEVYCPACDTTGVIRSDGPRLVEMINGCNAALDDDICSCKCDPPPRLIANQTRSSQIIGVDPSPHATAAAPFATQPKNAGGSRHNVLPDCFSLRNRCRRVKAPGANTKRAPKRSLHRTAY